jgi:hypothetical protein
MCYLHVHQCKYCKSEYECALENYICPTINFDRDQLLCDLCRKRLEDELLNIDVSESPTTIEDILLGDE